MSFRTEIITRDPSNPGAPGREIINAGDGPGLRIRQEGPGNAIEVVVGNSILFSVDRTGVATSGTSVFTSGDAVQVYVATTGQAKDYRIGTAASPDTSTSPGFKIVRSMSVARAALTGDGGEQMATVLGIASGDASNQAQVVGLYGAALNKGTSNGGSGSPDGAGVYGVGRITNTGIGVGIGGFFAGRRDTNTGKANAVEISSQNYTASVGVYNSTGFSDTTGLWVEAIGNSDSAVGISFGNPFGFQYDIGVAFTAQLSGGKTGGVKTASIRDDSSSLTSLFIAGSHATAAIQVANNAGPILFGSGNNIGVFGHAAAGQQTVAGSRGGNAALASLLTAMAATGWIVDTTTA